jgi:hypothetical protein
VEYEWGFEGTVRDRRVKRVKGGKVVTTSVRLLGALGLGCEFVHLARCETTWVTTSFTLCQETRRSNGEELRIRRFEISKRREKTTRGGCVQLKRIKTSSVTISLSLVLTVPWMTHTGPSDC